jgi:nitronate monooxygenase
MSLLTRLGLALPIIQAPMAGVQGSALAVAVSNAGGLGSLPCAMLTPEVLRTELAALGSQTRQAFNVNFFCHTPPVADAARESRWRSALSPYYAEFGIDTSTLGNGPGRAPFSQAVLEVIAPFRPAVVSFHFGLPAPELLQAVKSWGATVLSTATTVEEARWLEAHGADAIIAQGLEAGGHRGMFLSEDLTTQLGTLSLLPQVVRAVRLPVIAAGGIADAQGVKAALALGAAAAQVGTSYLLCPEATTSALHRAALVSERAQHTALTNLLTGRPARGMYNRLMKELGPLSSAPPAFPLATAALAPLKAAAEQQGRDDFSTLWSGQNASGCRNIPAAELTRALASG